MSNLIEIRDLTKTFSTTKTSLLKSKGTFTAVDQFNLTIQKGEIIGLIGESGSGKSTIGRMILKLIEPTSGHILYDGKDITRLTHREMMAYYQKMQIIFQDSASSFNPRKNIGDQIVTPMLRLGVEVSRKKAEEQVQRMLEKVGLKREHFYRYPHEFSGGQRQRIGIARALALKPEFLVLDEPTSALDVSIQAQILNLLLDLQEEFQLTYLFIGHNLSVIEFFCDRVAVLYKGRLVELADSTSLYSKALHPVSRLLLASVLTLDKELEEEKESIEEEKELVMTDHQSGCVFSAKCPHATELCLSDHPPMNSVNGDHHYACFHPQEIEKVV
ncbi:ABC transporter ATP-binding protein [Pullulanibacillus sp. KACC 23026]|uniref:oligopeptide/dipeptide ABC transporter ATP-binding protein n=1 Tax=Pullulanibacillus sp. KACC 23026 TaxID=3028315 RepID=UPI0023AF04BE|nr:ABC transporter ATP-binding protein [Pullulanibacillus sp. KACC 23026]WEG11025.1 ABC transporter ATP-binding protein [Pullulanibacillus sp. KACC 23026]